MFLTQILRLVILVFLEISNMRESTQPIKVGRSQSSGQPLRPCTTVSTHQPVMSGAMAVSSMRYGVLVLYLTVISQLLR